MNRLEMAQKLFKNPELKAESNLESRVEVCINGIGVPELRCINDKKVLRLELAEYEAWEIIKPKLKEFTFGEMIHILFKSLSVVCSQCKSVVTNLDYTRDMNKISIEEYDGKWTIEGYYEE